MGVLDEAFLEAEEVVAAGVSFHRRRLAQDVAQVNEMLLVGGRFLALVAGPFLFEFSDRHAHWGSGYSRNPSATQTVWLCGCPRSLESDFLRLLNALDLNHDRPLLNLQALHGH